VLFRASSASSSVPVDCTNALTDHSFVGFPGTPAHAHSPMPASARVPARARVPSRRTRTRSLHAVQHDIKAQHYAERFIPQLSDPPHDHHALHRRPRLSCRPHRWHRCFSCRARPPDDQLACVSVHPLVLLPPDEDLISELAFTGPLLSSFQVWVMSDVYKQLSSLQFADPVQFTWSGGSPPYFLTCVPMTLT
jgi:hypothetical protein